MEGMAAEGVGCQVVVVAAAAGAADWLADWACGCGGAAAGAESFHLPLSGCC